ncbi:hypothetical protein BKA58DRAFT_45850 [Alternaria rosae]|uniref:uncharacterized protein n=1 Tax=Alternaria rosae TaxID=1187941 RepID=UPI001E8CE72D|nr:uncharacterized protein BKA58DRAFT_45850 [Alternaria rosae]KAH6861068.1 hypothetical protein BKA58DRAFT_45850 [Alternaria rosae]
MESLGPPSSEGYGSYVYVDHSDAKTSDELCQATKSAGDAEQHENFAGSSGQDLERHWLEHRACQNSPYGDQFGYPQSSASGYSLQSGAGPPYATDGQHTHQTERFDHDQPLEPFQRSAAYFEASSGDRYPQYAAPNGHNSQWPGFTQPLYNFPDAVQPYPTYDPYIQDNNTMPAPQDPVVRYLGGSRPAEYRRGDRQRHLEQQVEQWMDVLNTPGIQGTANGSNRAHGAGPTSLDSEWGGSSVDTLRPSGPRSGSLSARTNYAPGPVSYNRQRQGRGSFMPPTYSISTQQSAQGRANPGQPAVYGTSRGVSNHDGNHHHVLTSETSSSRPTSPGSSATSDPLQCPYCPATAIAAGTGDKNMAKRKNGSVRPVIAAARSRGPMPGSSITDASIENSSRAARRSEIPKWRSRRRLY